MKRIMVRYTVKPERVAENEELITEVFHQLDSERPAGVRYASFKLDDGASFVHLVEIEDPDHNPLRELAAFKAFTANVRDRCAVAPVTSVLTQIGSYRVFDEELSPSRPDVAP